MSAKIQAVVGDEAQPFEYGNTFARESVSGRDRLVIGVNDAQDECIQLLALGLEGPFQLLYVLHTSRTGAELGRYESPDLDASRVETFLRRFGRFFCEDARHDLWVRSHGGDATVVLDRHNVIYAYGPVDTFERVLSQGHIRPGARPEVPDPHIHYYHSEWDEAERDVIVAFPWKVTPLRPGDIQVPDSTAG
jgi:hypothetical protein